MRKLLLLLFILSFGLITKAQLTLHSDQLQHFELLNPAYTGAQEQFNLGLTYTASSIFEDTYMTDIKFSQQIRKGNWGIGNGFNRTDFRIENESFYESMHSGQIAYHIELSAERQLSVGVSGKMVVWDYDNITYTTPRSFPAKVNLPNLGLGIFYQGKLLELGVSVPNTIGGFRTITNNKFYHFRPIQFLAATKISIISDIYIKPSLLIGYNHSLLNNKSYSEASTTSVKYALALAIKEQFIVGSSSSLYIFHSMRYEYVEEVNFWLTYQSKKGWRTNAAIRVVHQFSHKLFDKYLYRITIGYSIK